MRDGLGAPLSWDLGFLALGVVLVVVGRAVHRAGSRDLAQPDLPARDVVADG